jgi:hypothetical protein
LIGLLLGFAPCFPLISGESLFIVQGTYFCTINLFRFSLLKSDNLLGV